MLNIQQYDLLRSADEPAPIGAMKPAREYALATQWGRQGGLTNVELSLINESGTHRCWQQHDAKAGGEHTCVCVCALA